MLAYSCTHILINHVSALPNISAQPVSRPAVCFCCTLSYPPLTFICTTVLYFRTFSWSGCRKWTIFFTCGAPWRSFSWLISPHTSCANLEAAASYSSANKSKPTKGRVGDVIMERGADWIGFMLTWIFLMSFAGLIWRKRLKKPH